MKKLTIKEGFYPRGTLCYRSVGYLGGSDQRFRVLHGYYEGYYADGDLEEKGFLKHDIDVGFAITVHWRRSTQW